jgi:hypothetical protein
MRKVDDVVAWKDNLKGWREAVMEGLQDMERVMHVEQGKFQEAVNRQLEATSQGMDMTSHRLEMTDKRLDKFQEATSQGLNMTTQRLEVTDKLIQDTADAAKASQVRLVFTIVGFAVSTFFTVSSKRILKQKTESMSNFFGLRSRRRRRACRRLKAPSPSLNHPLRPLNLPLRRCKPSRS